MTWIVLFGLLILFGSAAKALSANAEVDRYADQEIREFPVVASDIIYKGALVGLNPAGYLKPFEPGDRFVGVAYEEVDNSSGAVGALNCKVFTQGDFEYTLTSVAVADVGAQAFATADDALALRGHPDAFVGRIVGYVTTNTCVVRLREFGEQPTNGEGCIELALTGHENFTATGATAGTACINGFDLKSILGTGWVCNDAEGGGIKGDFDAVAEVALCSARARNDCLPVDCGLTLDVDLCVADSGDSNTLDVDWGFGTALTTNSEADIDHADMVQLASFHMDGNSDSVLCQSDDNTTDVAPASTLVNNDSTGDTFKHYKIIARPAGTVEFWIDNARVLSTTAFALLSTALVAPFINMEKTSNDTTASIIFKNLRVGAAQAA